MIDKVCLTFLISSKSKHNISLLVDKRGENIINSIYFQICFLRNTIKAKGKSDLLIYPSTKLSDKTPL